MKRKVVKQGNNTLTITLPRKWTEQFGVKSGDELEVEEKGSQLCFGCKKNIQLETIKIDASELNDRALRWVLASVHKAGYEEIEIVEITPEKTKIIHELIKDLYMGFSVIEQTSKRCVLKSVSKESESEFDTVLRRAFMVALSMAESTIESLKNKDYSSMSSLIALEHTNNQLTNFCERIINKIGYGDGKKNSFYYVISWNLEKVCDNYKYICDYFVEEKNIGEKESPSKEAIEVLENATSFFRWHYDNFYKFDVNKLSKHASEGKKIISDINELGKSIKKKSDFIILSMSLQIVYQCMDFSASSVAIHQKK